MTRSSRHASGLVWAHKAVCGGVSAVPGLYLHRLNQRSREPITAAAAVVQQGLMGEASRTSRTNERWIG